MALDIGITEADFWSMTIAELRRLFQSKARVMERKQQEQASFDYVLADLIGRSIARLYSANNTYPMLSEAYPTLFNKEEEEQRQQQKKDELSAIRFRMFANSINRKMEVKS